MLDIVLVTKPVIHLKIVVLVSSVSENLKLMWILSDGIPASSLVIISDKTKV